mmetsp:Transcript_2130/g.8302  ORF Transcript_2130/g.8302 Transcript_2130/m.8302 type:complete len:271 (+) Transcript_2130:2003-2815(+)
MSLVHDERTRGGVEILRRERKHQLGCGGYGRFGRGGCGGDEAEVQRRHRPARVVQHVEPVPTSRRIDDADGVAHLVNLLQQRVAVAAAEQTGADDDEGVLGLLERRREGVLAGDERLHGGRRLAQLLHRIGEVAVGTDGRHVRAARDVSPAKTRVEHGSLHPRVASDEEHDVGILDADDVGVEEVRRSSVGGDALHALGDGVAGAHPVHQVLERDDGLGVAELTRDRLDPRRVRRSHLGGDDFERAFPRRGRELTRLFVADQRLVQTLPL